MRRALLVVMVLAAVGSAVIGTTQGHAMGALRWNGRDGCGSTTGCHSDHPVEALRMTVSGLPERYTPGYAYPVKLSVDEISLRTPAQFRSGFAVDAIAGRLDVAGDIGRRTTHITDGVSHSPPARTLTHTALGARIMQWEFTWTAPEDGQLARVYMTGYLSRDEGPLWDDYWKTVKFAIPSAMTSKVDEGFALGGLLLILGFAVRRPGA